jgi:transposase
MRFSFESRCRVVALVLAGESPAVAAAACGASRATGYRLCRRYREGGWAALMDRPPVPRHQPRRLPRELEQRILAARSYANAGPLIVAAQLGLPASTVWKVLRRYGVSRLPSLSRGPVTRYERQRPGELIHVDIKRLGRFWTVGKRIYSDGLARSRRAGWQYLHLAIDDHSRLAYAELLPTESPAACSAFLRRATAWYREQGIVVERVLSDNGNGYRSFAWRDTCAELHIQRRYTRPRRPQTDQRQSRGARQDAATRVGLPLRLSHQHAPRPRTPRLHALVQPPPSAQLARRPPTNQPRLTSLWDPQLIWSEICQAGTA